MGRRGTRFQTLVEVSRVMGSSLRLDRVLELVIEQGMRALEAEAGTLWLLDRDAGRIVPVAALGPKGEAIKQLWLHPGEGIAGTTLVRKESFLVGDVRKAPQWAARFDCSIGFETRSVLCVPLVYRDAAIGALQFVNKTGGRSFGRADLALARALAGQAAVAIANSRAFEDQVIKALEEERRRIARDIHDGPAQLLAGLVLRVEICQRLLHMDSDRAGTELEDLKERLRESLGEVRGIIFDLRPLALDELGLAGALRAYLNGLDGRAGLAVMLSVEGEERRLPPALEVTIYRVVQEAVNNARKHAHASRVTVRLAFRAERVEAVVEDDGVGFDVEVATRRGGDHFGLAGMRERVELMDGTLQIASQPGRGTRLSFCFPLVHLSGGFPAAEPGLPLKDTRVS